MKKIQLVIIFVLCLSFVGCKGSAKDYRVDFVDRNAVFALDKKLNPLRLVVEINENGKLILNKIETGTIDDVTELSKKLKAIFDDREKAGIDIREVVIDPQGKVNSEELEILIESLMSVKAAPIRVIKNNLE